MYRKKYNVSTKSTQKDIWNIIKRIIAKQGPDKTTIAA